MRKILLLAFLTVTSLTIAFQTANAATFIQLDKTSMPWQGRTDWSRSYSIANDTFDIRLHYATNNKTEPHQITVWRNNQIIFNKYLNPIDNGWYVSTYWEQDRNLLFFSASSANRAYLFGYNKATGKIVRYLDSKDFYAGFNKKNDWASPSIFAYTDGTLVLALFDGYDDAPINHTHIYRLDWDMQRDWLSYTDMGITSKKFSTIDIQ